MMRDTKYLVMKLLARHILRCSRTRSCACLTTTLPAKEKYPVLHFRREIYLRRQVEEATLDHCVSADKALTNYDPANHGELVPALFEAWLPQHFTSGHITRQLCASLTFLEFVSLDLLLTDPRRGAKGSRAPRSRVHTTSVIDRQRLLLTAERLRKFRAHSNLATKIVR
jgi:hypothetical protein